MSSPRTFADLGVPAPLVAALDRQRITEPFEIQGLVLADALDGRDILGRAPTGSGKTLAFGLPTLARVGSARPGRPTGLILSPTRELAEQITTELAPLAKAMKRRVLAVYGGTGLGRQLSGLERGVDVLVACPGRLLDLIDQGAVDLNEVEVAVVDEADRMADMGFLPDVRRLLDRTGSNRQTMLFSATLDNDVKVLVDRYQREPVEHTVAEPEPDLSRLRHRFIRVEKKERIWLAGDLITDHGPTIVFVRTRYGVDRVARQLRQVGVKTSRIHGGRSQSQRDQALRSFSDGSATALIATDVAARGIHVDGVACVIHFDPPADHKDYVHRSGRTGRAGADGVVVSLLAPNQVSESKKMQRELGIDAEIEPTPVRVHFLDPVAAPGPKRPGKSRSRSNRSGQGKSNPKSKSGSGARSKSGSGSKSGSRSKSGSKPSGRPASGGRSGAGGSSGSKPGAAKPTARSGSGKPSRGKSTDNSSDKPRSSQSSGSSRSSGTSRNGDSSASQSKSQSGSRRSRARARDEGAGTSPSSKGGSADSRTGHSGNSKRSASSGSGGKSGPKGRSQRPKSKRSGKPRPANRKNRPAGRSRKRSASKGSGGES